MCERRKREGYSARGEGKMNIYLYHWFWYFLGFIFCPQLTIMIWVSLYFKNYLPLPLFVLGWIIAILTLVPSNLSEK